MGIYIYIYIYIYVCHASAHALRMRRIIIIIITCIYVQWVAMVFLVYFPRRFGMQLPLVAMVLREASALMRISSIIIIQDLTQSGENLIYPCFILGFIKCTAFMKSSTNSDLISTNGTKFTLLKVIPLQEHHQRYILLYILNPLKCGTCQIPIFKIMFFFLFLVYSATVHILCSLVIVHVLQLVHVMDIQVLCDCFCKIEVFSIISYYYL